MTDLMEKAIEALRRVPDRRQDDLALVVMELAAGSAQVYRLSPEEEADLAQSEAEAARGEFATDEEVRAVWAKYGA